MPDVFSLIVSLVAGVCAGALFFAGLWRTVSIAVGSTMPALLFVLSFAIRATLLLAVLWLVSRGNPFRLAACMLGFFVARAVILGIHRVRKELAN